MFEPGQLVVISVNKLNYSKDGFVTGPTEKNGGMRFYETIDMETYPSWNDFCGPSTIAYDGDIATICRLVGRPARINVDPIFFYYDIYEILIHGTIRQAFKQNLVPNIKKVGINQPL